MLRRLPLNGRAWAIAAAMLGFLAAAPASNAGIYKLIPPPHGQSPEKEVDQPPPTNNPPPSHQTPEPATLILATLGAGTLAAWNRRRNKK